MLGKDKLVFDTAVSLVENDNVGAYLRSSTGTLITDTGGSLNVNVTNSVTVTATDFDIRDLDAAQDNVAISDGTDTLAINADGSINTTINNVDDFGIYAEDSAHASGDVGQFVLAVRNDAAATSLTSADGDYSPVAVDEFGRLFTISASQTAYAEDSAHTTGDLGDFVLAVRQDTLASSVSADGDYAAFKLNSRGGLWTVPVGTVADDAADSENPVKVGSRAESGALSAVADGDRADLLSDSFRRIYVNSSPNITSLASAVTVTTTATPLPATALTGRRYILIQNLGGSQMFIGDAAVTSSSGVRLAAGASWEGELGDDVVLYAIKASGSSDVRVYEIA